MLVPLAHADGLRVDEYVCDGLGSDADERNQRREIVFVRRGAFRVESERGSAVVDARHVLLLNKGESFGVRHPVGCGDRCLVLGLDDELTSGFLGTPAIDDRRPEAPFRFLTLPSSRELHAAAETFRDRVREERRDPLLAAEELLRLVAQALREPATTDPDLPHRAVDLVEAVRLELLRRLGDRLPLPELARAVGASPFHLARFFRRATGTSIHQYRLELRLREARARIAEGAGDLTRLALELGFADHAHFTNAFRRRWGVAPSRLLSGLRPLR